MVVVIVMIYKTKISKGFQTVVPSKIRKKMGILPGDITEWRETSEGIIVTFRKKVTIDDITGFIKEVESNAVEAKKKVQKGEKS